MEQKQLDVETSDVEASDVETENTREVASRRMGGRWFERTAGEGIRKHLRGGDGVH